MCRICSSSSRLRLELKAITVSVWQPWTHEFIHCKTVYGPWAVCEQCKTYCQPSLWHWGSFSLNETPVTSSVCLFLTLAHKTSVSSEPHCPPSVRRIIFIHPDWRASVSRNLCGLTEYFRTHNTNDHHLQTDASSPPLNGGQTRSGGRDRWCTPSQILHVSV